MSDSRGGVVVTGGSRGIGAAICQGLLDVGYRVVSLDLAEPTDRAVASEHVLGAAGDRDAIEHAIAVAREDGRLVGFVANAGITQVSPSPEADREGWDRVLEVNLTSVFEGARVARTYLGAGGAIVALSSLSAILALPDRAAYVATKSAIVGLVKSLAVEFGPAGIRVNAVAPGLIDTELSRRSRELGALPPVERSERMIPLRRLGTPEDVATVVAFLLGDASSYVTGLTIPIDGGLAVAFPGV